MRRFPSIRTLISGVYCRASGQGITAGTRIGRLVVLGHQFRFGNSWHVVTKCDCATVKAMTISSLTAGDAKSCGCYHSEATTARSFLHGENGTRLNRIWVGMKTRCYNPNTKDYSRYGGRGIKVWDEWHAFVAFRSWAMANGYTDELTLDRIDNDGDYSPSNCRWVTQKMQCRNSTRNRLLTIYGKSLCIVAWSEIAGVSQKLISNRVCDGWNHKEAVFGRSA